MPLKRCFRRLEFGHIVAKSPVIAIGQKGAENVEEKAIYSRSANLTLNAWLAKGKRALIVGTSKAAANVQYSGEPCMQ